MGPIIRLFLLATICKLTLGQNCPISGPSYPEVRDPALAPAFEAAKVAIQGRIADGIASGTLNDATAFSIQVFSRHSNRTLFEQYHGPQIGSETLYRIASVSKLVSVYTTLVELGDKYWDKPITEYVPELAEEKLQDPIHDVDWSEVTLGSLASHMSGIPRDYSLGDASTATPEIPGIPTLNDTERLRCGNVGVPPCTREETFDLISKTFPTSHTFHTPAYSNLAFQLLSYAVEEIAQQKFPDLVAERLINPLNLTRTFVTLPADDTDAVKLDEWNWDLGEEAPAGGYYSSASDLTKLGRAILSSTLLLPVTTRRWLQPISHTASRTWSVGRPWEIWRLDVPVSTKPPVDPTNGDGDGDAPTRLVDIFTKQGSTGGYISVLALSPDHGVGYSLLTGGPGSSESFAFLKKALNEVWWAAAEEAGRENVSRMFAGNYTLALKSIGEGGGETVAEFKIDEGEPGLFLERLVSDGHDVLASLKPAYGIPDETDKNLGMWFYPTGLAYDGKVAFRGVVGLRGVSANDDDCISWVALDLTKYGGRPADLVIFELADDGEALAVEVPLLKKSLKKDSRGMEEGGEESTIGAQRPLR
ncbi:beta-lactamase/transpeptidase-like protein [Dichotomopilus funicola]|uniref:Beta-lactamase/transpeptidase-like protein n=1 Tax=Dichotomopilus funicola TaxID=1934379 RepID=A0AAN6ZNV8_9PEZI|nr:beta-lactamase/transpeptidase-like protein [Dichotomopilus funicola]